MTRRTGQALVLTLLLLCCQSALGQFYPIRRSTPCTAGDRWRSDITIVKTASGTVRVAGEEKRVNEKEITNLSAVVEITQVDEDGYPLTWTARIVRFSGPDGTGNSATLLPAGTLVLFDRTDNLYVAVDENGLPLEEPADQIQRLLELPSRSDDGPFEPEANKNVGDEWTADIASLRATLIAEGPPQLRQHPNIFAITSTGSLLATREHRDTQCLDIGFTTQADITQELEDENQYLKKMSQKVEERFLFPADYSQDFLDRRTVATDVILTEGKGAQPSLDVTQVTTTSEKRTYVEFQRGGVRPWKEPARKGAILDDLLLLLDFDPISLTGEGNDHRIQSQGRIAQPHQVTTSGIFSGKISGAMRFDGQDDHVIVSGAAEALRAGTEAVTVACWVKMTPKPVQFIYDVGFYGGTSFSLVVTDLEAKFWLNPGAGGVGLQFPIVADQWTHVAVTWDGEMQKAYIDGKLIAEAPTDRKGTLNQNTIGADLPFQVGAQAKAPSRDERFFEGQLDEFAVWTRALDASEIATLFSKGNRGQSLLE